MPFGFAIGDFLVLTQLAWNVVQNSRKACGAHAALTHEVTCLHVVLGRLQVEIQTATSPIHRMTENDGRRNELNTIIGGCNRVLRVLDQVLRKYSELSDETRRTTRLWQRIRFGNGELKDLDSIKRELTTYTFAITIFLNLLSLSSQGRVEQHMETHSVELRELRHSLNWITASLQAGSNNREESILTSYADDDRKIWKQFRRELLSEGFSSKTLSRHKSLIKDYVLELGARGALDTPVISEPIIVGDQELEKIENGVSLVNTEPNDLRSEVDAVAPTPNPFINSQSHPDRGSEDIALYVPEYSRIGVFVSDSHPSSVLDLSTLSGTVESFPSILDRNDSVTLYASEVEGNSSFSTEVEEPDSPSQHGDEAGLHIIVDKSQPIGPATSCAAVESNRISLAATVEEVEDEDFIAATHPNCGDSSLREETDIPSPIDIDGAPATRTPNCDTPATEREVTERRFTLLRPELPSYSNRAEFPDDESSISEEGGEGSQAEDSCSSRASDWSRMAACNDGVPGRLIVQTLGMKPWRVDSGMVSRNLEGATRKSIRQDLSAWNTWIAANQDAQRHAILPGDSLIHWSPRQPSILLLGGVYDAESVGILIHQWTANTHGPATPITNMAADFRQLLTTLVAKPETVKQFWGLWGLASRERNAIEKESRRLINRLANLLQGCETPILGAGNKILSTSVARSQFIDSLFGRDKHLEDTKKLMTSLRLWITRFDAWLGHRWIQVGLPLRRKLFKQ